MRMWKVYGWWIFRGRKTGEKEGRKLVFNAQSTNHDGELKRRKEQENL